MGSRSDLHAALETLLGSSEVYFQPPQNVTMVYPCITYKRDGGSSIFANNDPYHHTKKYLVTIISKDPDFDVFDKMLSFPTCVMERTFVTSGLHHCVYVIHF